MVPKPGGDGGKEEDSFRAVLFRMVPKLLFLLGLIVVSFRAVLFRMVPKPLAGHQ